MLVPTIYHGKMKDVNINVIFFTSMLFRTSYRNLMTAVLNETMVIPNMFNSQSIQNYSVIVNLQNITDLKKNIY